MILYLCLLRCTKRITNNPSYSNSNNTSRCIFGDADVTLDPDLASVRAYVEDIHPNVAFHVLSGVGHWAQYEASAAVNALLPELID